jgi:hypothetical protein
MGLRPTDQLTNSKPPDISPATPQPEKRFDFDLIACAQLENATSVVYITLKYYLLCFSAAQNSS